MEHVTQLIEKSKCDKKYWTGSNRSKQFMSFMFMDSCIVQDVEPIKNYFSFTCKKWSLYPLLVIWEWLTTELKWTPLINQGSFRKCNETHLMHFSGLLRQLIVCDFHYMNLHLHSNFLLNYCSTFCFDHPLYTKRLKKCIHTVRKYLLILLRSCYIILHFTCIGRIFNANKASVIVLCKAH